ncbi:Dipeptidyl-peptidase 5 [Entomophthora muscae]|uniref:Dipeptidyl-peptidase 5 n=1 Tax=Entomophthora muscae TaxID=34485 RepID=A0ACC2T7L2_9FUNG|nr:Dipeptidyl-peptidase 5 [Entomophthora muscae]
MLSWKAPAAPIMIAAIIPYLQMVFIVAFVTMPASKSRAWKTTSQLLIFSSKDNRTSVISSGLGAISNPEFSPSGDMLAWLQTYDTINEAAKKQIQLMEFRSGKIFTLGQDWDNSPLSLTFSMDQTRLFLTAHDQGTTSLFSIHLSNQTRTRLTFTGTSSFITDGNNIILKKSYAHHPPEIYSLSANGTETKISNFYQSELAKFNFNRYEPFHFRGANNDVVQGFIVKPPNFQPTIKYPVVLYIHGGPEDSFGDVWGLRWNYQIPAQAGYVVVGINFHGSTGFGMYFTNSIRNNWSTLPFMDLMLGMDFVRSYFPFANTENAAAWGASYGGYMINVINGKTNRFKALVCHDGIFQHSLCLLYHR